MNGETQIERRRDYGQITTDIALLKQEMKHIRDSLGELKGAINVSNTLADNNRVSLVKLASIEQSFNAHVIQDRWMFGIIISLLGLILFRGLTG